MRHTDTLGFLMRDGAVYNPDSCHCVVSEACDRKQQAFCMRVIPGRIFVRLDHDNNPGMLSVVVHGDVIMGCQTYVYDTVLMSPHARFAVPDTPVVRAWLDVIDDSASAHMIGFSGKYFDVFDVGVHPKAVSEHGNTCVVLGLRQATLIHGLIPPETDKVPRRATAWASSFYAYAFVKNISAFHSKVDIAQCAVFMKGWHSRDIGLLSANDGGFWRECFMSRTARNHHRPALPAPSLNLPDAFWVDPPSGDALPPLLVEHEPLSAYYTYPTDWAHLRLANDPLTSTSGSYTQLVGSQFLCDGNKLIQEQDLMRRNAQYEQLDALMHDEQGAGVPGPASDGLSEPNDVFGDGYRQVVDSNTALMKRMWKDAGQQILLHYHQTIVCDNLRRGLCPVMGNTMQRTSELPDPQHWDLSELL